LDLLKNEIIETAQKIETEKNFSPKTNPLCEWCDFGHLCPLKKGKVIIKKSDTDIENIVQEYILAQEKITELEPKIHAHLDEKKIEKISHKNSTITRGKNKKLQIKKNI